MITVGTVGRYQVAIAVWDLVYMAIAAVLAAWYAAYQKLTDDVPNVPGPGNPPAPKAAVK